MARVDGFAGDLAAFLEFERGLDLRLQVVAAAQGDIGFLHEFQEGRLDAAPAHIATGDFARGGDFIDLVDVNDAVLREGHIAVGLLHQLAHEIIDIAADIAGLAEFRGVGFDERHANQIGDMFDEIGFADTGRAGDEHILLGVFERRRAGLAGGHHAGVVVVVAHGDPEDFLGLVLTNHKAVEMRLHLARGEMKILNRRRNLVGRFHGSRGFFRGTSRRGGKGRSQEFLQAALQLLRGGKHGIAHAFCIGQGGHRRKRAEEYGHLTVPRVIVT